jgi:hypothetical protein
MKNYDKERQHQMASKYLLRAATLASFFVVLGVIGSSRVCAQVTGPQETKWLSVGQLQQYFSNACMEIEYGLNGRGPFLNTDQDIGLRWPAQWLYQDHNVGKALWIGTSNFKDPSNGMTYPYKVLALGRGTLIMNSVVSPVQFSLVGKFNYPTVIVDGVTATNLATSDLNSGKAGEDAVDPTLPCDRMIFNQANTPIGITITRKVLNWAQQYNDNYYIYEWTFKNTGLTDNAGGRISPVETLHDVMFSFIYRFADDNDGYRTNWPGYAAGSNWGRNTINDCIGQDAAHTLAAPNNFRAIYTYYGPNSTSSGITDDIGGPSTDGRGLGGAEFCGEMVLHADVSTTDKSDALNQPSTTQFLASDSPLNTQSATSPFQTTSMTQQYQMMTMGHPSQTQAEQIGEDVNGWPTAFASTWTGSTALGSSAGGYESQQSFGPYTIPPGDSINIVVCEAIAGISHPFSGEVARNWYNWYNNGKSGSTQLRLPPSHPVRWPNATWTAGGTTTDGDEYKNAWVFTGEDSLLQTFRRARTAYSNLTQGIAPVPEPPLPPDKFVISSGGDRILLQWSTNAESAPHFNGYLLYRATTKTDTEFALIKTIDKGDLAAVAPIDPASGLRTYADASPVRGFSYFYYVQTKDDGSTNNVEPGVPLVSSMFYTMTNTAASLRRPFGGANGNYNLSAIRIVPNPYNISAKGIQYGTDNLVADQLSFFNLPPLCKISIFTEMGELIQTINHTNGSGDETWNSQTSSGQIVASGLYIAYFEVTQDYPLGSGNPIYRKGDSIYKKFIIIR